MIDAHCHLNDKKFNEDLENVILNYKNAGINSVVCVGWDLPSSIKAREISNRYNGVYYAVGVHPDNVDSYNEQVLEQIIIDAQYKKKENGFDDKLVAIGEIGLDYFHNKDNKKQQKDVFINQIKLANKYQLPIIIHCRDAYGDTLEILKQYAPFKYGAVMHCYGGSLEYANELIKLNIKMSFTGTVTFKNAKNIQQVAENIPVNFFFFETDCPYLTPEPNRGTRNEPMYVRDVLNFVSKLRNIDPKELEDITDKNAKQFFNLQ